MKKKWSVSSKCVRNKTKNMEVEQRVITRKKSGREKEVEKNNGTGGGKNRSKESEDQNIEIEMEQE